MKSIHTGDVEPVAFLMSIRPCGSQISSLWYVRVCDGAPHQATSMAYDDIDEEAIYLCSGNPLPRDIDAIFQHLLNSSLKVGGGVGGLPCGVVWLRARCGASGLALSSSGGRCGLLQHARRCSRSDQWGSGLRSSPPAAVIWQHRRPSMRSTRCARSRGTPSPTSSATS